MAYWGSKSSDTELVYSASDSDSSVLAHVFSSLSSFLGTGQADYGFEGLNRVPRVPLRATIRATIRVPYFG